MIFNWNSNDSKYFIKKIIILLCVLIALTILTTWKAHALELGKPNHVAGYICNRNGNQIDCNGGFWLQNNASNITDLVFINDSPTTQERYWKVFSYNDNERLASNVIVYDNFATIKNSSQILNFKWAYTTQLSGDIEATTISKVYLQYTDNTIAECGVVSRGGSEYIQNKWASVSEIKCIATKTIQRIFIDYYHATSDYIEETYYLSEIAIERPPVSNEELLDTQQQIKDGIQNTTDLIENSYTTNANSFFDNFLNNSVFDEDVGLQSIITLPLHMVSNLSNTCQPITLTLPFVNGNITLPCMSTIYQTHFNGLYTLISVVINGFFIYRILIKIYQLIHDAKDPAQDKLEVVEL